MTHYAALVGRMALAIALSSTGLVLGACSAGNDSAQESESAGRLNLALTSTSASGIKYRLRGAEFQIEASGFSQDRLSSETDPDATTLTAELQPGAYTVVLDTFWNIEKEVSPGVYETVPAELLNGNTQSFTIAEGVSTAVTYQFKVAGELVVMGGTLVISTTIVEESCQDDLAEENDTVETARPITAGQSYDLAICTGDRDYFVLSGVNGNRLTVDLSFLHDEGDLDVYVTNEHGESQGSGINTEDNEHVVIEQFAGARAIIRVQGFLNASNTYGLSTLVEVVPGGVPTIPEEWTCNDSYYGTVDGCDCGCGIVDPDCASPTAACAYDNCPDPTSPDPTNNALCQ